MKKVYKPSELFSKNNTQSALNLISTIAKRSGISSDLEDYNIGDYILEQEGMLIVHDTKTKGAINSDSWGDNQAGEFKSDGEEEEELLNGEKEEAYQPTLKDKIDKLVYQHGSNYAKKELEKYLKQYVKIPNPKTYANKLARIVKKKFAKYDSRTLAKNYDKVMEDLFKKKELLSGKRNIVKYTKFAQSFLNPKSKIPKVISKMFSSNQTFNSFLKTLDKKELTQILELILGVI